MSNFPKYPFLFFLLFELMVPSFHSRPFFFSQALRSYRKDVSNFLVRLTNLTVTMKIIHWIKLPAWVEKDEVNERSPSYAILDIAIVLATSPAHSVPEPVPKSWFEILDLAVLRGQEEPFCPCAFFTFKRRSLGRFPAFSFSVPLSAFPMDPLRRIRSVFYDFGGDSCFFESPIFELVNLWVPGRNLRHILVLTPHSWLEWAFIPTLI